MTVNPRVVKVSNEAISGKDSLTYYKNLLLPLATIARTVIRLYYQRFTTERLEKYWWKTVKN